MRKEMVVWRTRRHLVSTFVDFLGVFTAPGHLQGAVCFKGLASTVSSKSYFSFPVAPTLAVRQAARTPRHGATPGTGALV